MNLLTQPKLKDRWGIGWFSCKPGTSPLGAISETLPVPSWINPIAGTFLADPFWFSYNQRRWILAEEYVENESKGRLVCLDPELPHCAEVAQVVLEKEFHLSYPFPIQEDGQLFLLPEAQQTRELRLWSCKEFPANWMPSTQLLDDFPAIDPTITKFEGIYYLWVGHQERDPRHQSFLFSSSSIHGPWKHHPCSPIRHHWTGRNGGAILQIKGELWRPCQNRRGTYGASLVLRKIQALSPQHYEEGVGIDWLPQAAWPYPNGLHHVHQDQDHWVFDAKNFVSKL